MKEYHYIWLEAHPDRTEVWLRDKLIDGFDIHHLDHDHDNNSPDNLVLMEHRDHFMVHSGGRPPIKRGSVSIRKPFRRYFIDDDGLAVQVHRGERVVTAKRDYAVYGSIHRKVKACHDGKWVYV